MASSKKPTYKVETKLVPERKRRKSDLVLMWQSIMDVTAIVVRELWASVIRLWEFLQIWFSTSERFLIQTWLEKYLPYVPEDFSESWRDGRLLAILLNKLQPGCFPDAYHLDPDYGLKNVYRVFDALEIYFGIKPNVTAEEIVTCSNGSDSKLFAILLGLKNLTDTQPENKVILPESTENTESFVVDQSCIVKGTGLAVGFVGRTTSFIIFCVTIADLDVVVEIKGPNSVCSERITKRSPRKRRSGFSFEYARHLTRSSSLTGDENSFVPQEDTCVEKRIIPLEYEIIGNQISLSYKPREKGKHKVTILWHGQHVSDSPYYVTVEDPLEIIETERVIPLKSAFKNTDVSDKNGPRKISFQLQGPQMKSVREDRKIKYRDKPAGKVISRKLIRYIVKINGKDIPVNADSTESLATELLKMDYDFETCPSFHRRNSWGFAGDAERKKSVIRQFCIDVKELDAQISQRRTRSLSVNPGSKKSLERSDSFDSLASKLNCLNEDVFESNETADENEENYAYINEDINTPVEIKKFPSSSLMEHDTYSEKNTNPLLSELTGSKFDKSLKECSNNDAEADTISSLSINETPLEKIDRPEDDFYPNLSPDSTSSKCTLINADKSDNISTSYYCTDKILPSNRLDHRDNIKRANVSFKSKIFWKCFKVNVCKKKIHKCSGKNSILVGKVGKFKITLFYKKISKNNSSFSSTSAAVYRIRNKRIKRILKAEKCIFSKNSENTELNDMKDLMKPNFKYEKKISDILTDTLSSENLNMLSKFTQKVKDIKNENPTEIKYTGNTELKAESDIILFYRNTPQHLQASERCKSSNTIEELESTRIGLKQKLKSVPDISICTAMKMKYENAILNHQNDPTNTSKRHHIFHSSYDERSSSLAQAREKSKAAHTRLFKPLRIHTLKTIDQFNFKQFNPSFDSENAISPVKSQIEHWENTLSPNKECVSSMKLREASDIEQVNVKEKLVFWECRTRGSSQNSSPENNRKMNLTFSRKSSRSTSDLLRNDDLQKCHCSESSSNLPLTTVKVKNDAFTEAEKNATITHLTEDEIPPEFQINSDKIRSPSFSDPVVSEGTTDTVENTAGFPSSESSTKDYFNSSSEDYSEHYDSGETEDSGGDYLLQSTEDEYIDDEICERASEYWGDLSIVKNWKMPNYLANDCSSFDEELLHSYNQRDKSYPEECKVYGIAAYYGYVAVKNRFQVFTCDAGFGNLSISMQGLRPHEVSLVSVAYMRSDIYEVTYQVMTAGYYLISIRWMDRDIPGSPFVCKVTF